MQLYNSISSLYNSVPVVTILELHLFLFLKTKLSFSPIRASVSRVAICQLPYAAY